MTYSTFALEQDTTLLLTSPSDHGFSQEWGLSIVDILSKGDLAESESVKAFTHKRILAVYNSLCPGLALRYLTIQSTTPLLNTGCCHILTHNIDGGH